MRSQSSVFVFGLPGNEELAAGLAAGLHAEAGRIEVHRFPDQESRIRVLTAAAGCDVVIACTLDHPNGKLVDLYLSAATLRQLGARSIILVAPYLPYMRQDRSFHAGEGVSAVHIGRWLSSFLDGLVTVDPHLHRIQRLGEVYSIPTRVVHAAGPIARWVRRQITAPVIIGPDAESRQWVSEVAHEVGCPYFVLDKVRQGDRKVEVHVPDATALQDHTPVLLDDIVSSGATMIAAARRLRAEGFGPPICIGVHALHTQGAGELLHQADIARLVTCNTIPHPSNAIDLNDSLTIPIRELLDRRFAEAVPA